MRLSAPPPYNSYHVQPKIGGFRDNKSFAKVIVGQKIDTSTSYLCHVIDLKHVERTSNWNGCVLTGEVANAQLIA